MVTTNAKVIKFSINNDISSDPFSSISQPLTQRLAEESTTNMQC